jgi:hypothetical protein
MCPENVDTTRASSQPASGRCAGFQLASGRSAGFQPATPGMALSAGKMPALHRAIRRVFPQPLMAARQTAKTAPIRRHLLPIILVMFAVRVSLWAQAPGDVVRLSPKIDNIVPAGARAEQVAEGFGFIEGPIWIHAGYLLFSDIPKNVILKYTPDGKVTVFRRNSGYDGVVPAGAIWGSNGLTLDRQGRLTLCEHGNRRVTRI